MEVVTCKCCRVCGVVKPMAEFPRDSTHRDGRRNECSPCKGKKDTRKRAPRSTPAYCIPVEPTGWPLSAEPDLTVQLLHLHMKRAYGATPGAALRGVI